MFTARRRPRLTAGATLLVAVLLLGACDWSQFRYGPNHTGFNPFETTIGPASISKVRLRWSQKVGSQGVTSPATIANGAVYAISGDKVYAFDANTGSARWSSEGIGVQLSAASVANDVVYVTTQNVLYALDATTGAKRWSSTAGGTSSTIVNTAGGNPPTIANGVVYVSTDNGLYALDATTGAKLWSSTAGGSTPTIANGVVYVSTANGLDALDATTGAKRWSKPLATATRVPAVTNGVVYVSTDNGFYALDAATGAQHWSAPDGDSSPAVANGVVFVGGHELDAYNAATGAKLWSASGGYGSPTVANGVVYTGGDQLDAYNAATGARLWSTATTGYPEPVIANGVVYVGGNALDPSLNAYSLPVTTPQLFISPAFDRDFVFGDPYSETRTYTVTNIGSTPTSAIADSLSGPDTAHFRLASDGCAGTRLAGGASCTVTASFAPTRSGSRAALLTAAATAGGTASALLTGTAQPLTISPTSSMSADTFAGVTSTTVFRLTNLTPGPVGPITNAVTSGSAWTVADDRCAGKTIAAGTSCTIAVTFAPTDSAYYTATLVADAPGHHAEAYLTGNGLARLKIAPLSKDFGPIRVGTTASATFTVTNISPIPAGPISDAIGAAFFWGQIGPFDWYTITSDSCAGHTLAANASCTLTVNFAPTSNTLQWAVLTVTAPLAGKATANLTGVGTY